MNQVDIYINDQRLDLFQDEEITINLSVQNVQDISKVFTDFTQNFTVPASVTNNRVFSYYYRTDLEGSFDGRLRVSAKIEINSLPFRTGVIELESVQLKGTEPYAYSLTFYGDVVSLMDLFGEDYLYDVDFSEFNHEYSDNVIFNKLTSNDDTGLFYPLCSPVKNWFYRSGTGGAANNENNIAYNTGSGGQGARGIQYYELKPALKVQSILNAIGQKYGISFIGDFLSATPFVDLSLWLHRYEGYLFSAGNDIEYQLINMNRNTGSGSQFNLATDTWDVPAGPSAGRPYSLSVTIQNASENYELAAFSNGLQIGAILVNAHPSTSVTTLLQPVFAADGAAVQLFIRPQQPTAMTYQCTDYTATNLLTSVVNFSVDQTLSASYSFQVVVQDIMPEIKVKDFLAGIIKMYNMVIVPTSATTFLLQPLDDWYASGNDKEYQEYLDITEYVVNRPPLYREIEFKYQETEQILGFQYLQTNNVGFGDLNVYLPFDGDEFLIELPFECPLFERLTDQANGVLTNVLVYKSITSEANEDGIFNPYLGAPILFYGYFENYDLQETNPVGFVNADASHEQVNIAWYANTSNRYSSAADSDSICFGADIDPYHLQSVNQSLYYNEWSDYITDLYSKQRRLYNVEAVLPIGKIITLSLQNAIVWNNTKYIVNNVSLNLSTGKAKFELLNVV
jgi:hypothetical protein